MKNAELLKFLKIQISYFEICYF